MDVSAPIEKKWALGKAEVTQYLKNLTKLFPIQQEVKFEISS